MTATREALGRLLRPRSAVFVGGKWARRAAQKCRELGFAGPLWLVNPNEQRLEGVRWVPDIAALPEPPDAVYLAVSREASVEVVGRLAALGAGGVVCFAAGFAEVGAEGASLQRALVEAAGDRLAVMGPNCWGFVNYLDRVSLWSDTWIRPAPVRGAAIVSQSGNLSITLSSHDRSLPLSYVVSVGNQATMGPAELVEGLTEDPRVSAIGLYMEGIPDIGAFAQAAGRALEQGIPLVALKVGATQGAARLALSHTSSLAGSDAAYAALFDRLGVIRVHTLAQMLETLKLLDCGGGLAGRRLISLSCSGGDAALMADRGARHGLEFPPFDASTAQGLRARLQRYTSVDNPFDYNTGVWGDRRAMGAVFGTALSGEFDAAVLIIDTPAGALQYEGEFPASHEAFIEACRDTGRRGIILSMLPELFPEDARARALAAGVAPLQGFDEGLTALDAAAWYEERRSTLRAQPLPAPTRARGACVEESASTVTLDEYQSKRWLQRAGIAVPESVRCDTATLLEGAARIGYPLVLKASSERIAHKSELGAVALDLRGPEELRAACSAMSARLAAAGHSPESFLLEPMVDDAVCELILGVQADTLFGPVLVVGSGGVLVELLADSVTLLLPTRPGEIARHLARLRSAALWQGFRGRPAGDFDALVEAVSSVAAFALDNAADLVELDINPLLVRPRGKGVLAADALLRIRTPHDRPREEQP